MSTFIAPWNLAENFSALTQHEVHVWSALLNYAETDLSQFESVLSVDEIVKAKRFHFAKDRIRYTAARGILRTIIGNYLQVDPQAVKFDYNSHGKPFCVNNPELQFNLSHSNKMVLYAFVYNQLVGIDVEYIDEKVKVDAIAKRFFSTHEAEQLQQLSGQQKIRSFFNAWTRKEAFLKALGQGLSYSLKKVEVTMSTDDPAKVLALNDPDQKISDWKLFSLDQIPGYAAALVVKGEMTKIKICS